MFHFGQRSMQRLITCHPVLRLVAQKALEISPFDLVILEGHRDEATQTAAYDAGRSKVKWPDSKHNKIPSMAVDIAPYPVEWNNSFKFYALGGIMFAAAQLNDIKSQGFALRWGGDWDRDWKNNDQKFNDLPHFELVAV